MTPPAIDLGYRRPRHVKQLQTGARTASVDCGPSTLDVCVQGASQGRIVIRPDRAADWTAAMRREMFARRGPTSLADHKRAAESDFTDGAMFGVARPEMVLAVGTLTHDTIVNWLARGAWIDVLIDYGRLNDLMPRLSGSPTYRGLHFVGLGGHAVARDVWCYLYDSLLDGRPARFPDGTVRGHVPRGVQTVRVKRYLRAAETAGDPPAGTGKAKVGVVKP